MTQANTNAFAIQNMPLRFTREDLDAFLLNCHAANVSDISLQSDMPVYVKYHGVTQKASFGGEGGKASAPAVEAIIRSLAGEDAVSMMMRGMDIDRRIVLNIPGSRRKTAIFRLNVTMGQAGTHDTIQATFRAIPESPPSLKDMNVEKEIIDNFFSRSGITIVGGATGSGKTTLLAAMIRHSIESGDSFKMNTYEAPPEFDLVRLSNENVLIHQCAIGAGGNLKRFADGVRNAMRRAPDRIIVGEARDGETMEATIEAANTGHWVGTTTHAGNASTSMRRITSCFSGDDRSSNLVVLVENLRLIVNQVLLPSPDGRRTALREFLICDQQVRQAMIDKIANPDEMPSIAAALIPKHGKSFEQSAAEALAAGRITQTVHDNFLIGQGIRKRA